MNYEPNLIQWHKGSIVIHDADAKEPKMLMRVIGYTRDGLVKTQYIDKRHKRTVWKNGKEFLHDPRRFDLLAQDFAQEYVERYQDDFERVRRWNRNHPEIGVPVLVPTTHAGIRLTRTITKAFMQGHHGYVHTQEYGHHEGDMWEIQFVADVSDDPVQVADLAEMDAELARP